MRWNLIPTLVVLLMVTAQAALPVAARATAATQGSVTALSGWITGASYYRLRAAPRLSAQIVGHVGPDQTLAILRSVPGDSVGGNNWWYQVQIGRSLGYMSTNGVATLVHAPQSWVGVTVSDGDPSVTSIATLRAPSATAPTAAEYPLNARFTVTGIVQGEALQPGNTSWYRIDQGALPPVYVYSAYMKYVSVGRTTIPMPLVTAAALAAVDLPTGHLLLDVNGTVPRYPASTVKLMTALLTLQHLPLTRRIRIPGGLASVTIDVPNGGGSNMGLQQGEVLSVHNLLYGLLLVSAGDAAYTLAGTIAGSQTAFVRMMNAEAKRIGMDHTRFTDPEGYDDPGEHTTALDLARLARYVLLHAPVADQIVGTQMHIIPATSSHPRFVLQNLNQLLGSYPGAFGVKTGTTPAAGENLIAAAQRFGRRILLVVLGSTNRYADATAVLDYLFATATDQPALPVTAHADGSSSGSPPGRSS